MPLNRLVTLLLIVIAMAGGTIWIVTSLFGQQALSENWMLLVPVVLGIYLAVRFLGMKR